MQRKELQQDYRETKEAERCGGTRPVDVADRAAALGQDIGYAPIIQQAKR